MQDNIIIENMKFTEEMYKELIKKNVFEEDLIHGIGEESNGNS